MSGRDTHIISLLPTIDPSTQLGWSRAGNFVVVIKSRERDKSTGSDRRCPRHPHTRQLSRQPKVKPPVRGSPELFRGSFPKRGTTGTVYMKQRVLPPRHHLKGQSSSSISTCYLVKSLPNSGARSVLFRNLALRKRLKDQGTTFGHVCRVIPVLTTGASSRCFYSILANVSQLS